jgi:hypothetical protein
MIFFSFQEFKTSTMIFESPYEVKKFLSAFEETDDFFKLVKSNSFMILLEDDVVKFFFRHKDNLDYILFLENIQQTNIKNFLHSLGWKVIKMGSGTTNGINKKS